MGEDYKVFTVDGAAVKWSSLWSIGKVKFRWGKEALSLLFVLLKVLSAYSICESSLEITEKILFHWVSRLMKK